MIQSISRIGQVITLFVSSTFNDMHAERDYIKDFVAPRLQEQFAPMGIELRFIDLRWGIITSDEDENEQKEAHILKVCFDEIERSKPFFIGLVGQRYGWIPGDKRFNLIDPHVRKYIPDGDRSVTEMEMLFGALNNSTGIQRAVFCLRNPIDVDDNHKNQYIETEPNNVDRLRKLRAHILAAVPINNIVNYSATWQDGKLQGLEDFGNQLYNVLCREITSNLDETKVLDQDPAQQSFSTMYVDLCRQLFNCTKTFVGRLKEQESLLGLIDQGKRIVLEGPRGCGKTALMAKLTDTLSRDSRLFPIYYSTTVNSSGWRADIMLNYFCALCARELGIPFTDLKREITVENMLGTYLVSEEVLIELESTFSELCNRLMSRGRQVVLLLDDFDGLDTNRYKNQWIFCPKHVPAIVVGATAGAEEYLHIGDLSYGEAKDMIRSTFAWFGKEIFASAQESMLNRANEVANVISQSNGYNALWISVATYYLIQFDADDFESILNTKADNEENRIERYCLEIIKQLPCNFIDLFYTIANRAGKRFGDNFVKRCITLLQLGRGGFRDSDFESMLGNDWDAIAFANFCRWMSPFITEDSRYHRWRLNRNWGGEVCDAIEQHMSVANMLKSFPKSDVVRHTELFYHAFSARMAELCAQLIADGSADDMANITPLMETLSRQELLDFCIEMVKEGTTTMRAEVLGKIILSAIVSRTFKDPQLATQITLSALPYITDDCYNSSYDYSCVCEVLKDRILNDKHFCSGQSLEPLATALHKIATRWNQKFPCKGADTALAVVIMELSQFYMKRGNMDKAMELLT